MTHTGWVIEDGQINYRIDDILRGGVASAEAYGYGLMNAFAVDYKDGHCVNTMLAIGVTLSEAAKAVEEHYFH